MACILIFCNCVLYDYTAILSVERVNFLAVIHTALALYTGHLALYVKTAIGTTCLHYSVLRAILILDVLLFFHLQATINVWLVKKNYFFSAGAFFNIQLTFAAAKVLKVKSYFS